MTSSATTEFQATPGPLTFRQSIRTCIYSVLVHSGLRDWRSAHWARNIAASIVAPRDFRAAQRKCASDQRLSGQEKAVLQKISLVVHRNDEMYVPLDAKHYLSTGLGALRCIESALQKASEPRPVRSILDFPCGYGRVLRFLRARFPDADITVSELDKGGLEFCSKTFSARAVQSDADFSKLSMPGRFDLIWCGSLLTHLDENSAAKLLQFFYEHLSPRGICLFTTHGKASADYVRQSQRAYGLNASARETLLRQYDDRGYGYADYSGKKGFGVSVASSERMLSLARGVAHWQSLSFIERGWDNHQDVYVAEAP
jgi:SAM-dependent methyltransferase